MIDLKFLVIIDIRFIWGILENIIGVRKLSKRLNNGNSMWYIV